MLSLKEARKLLSYDPDTGVLAWRVDRRVFGNVIRAGSIAGGVSSQGYVRICIDGQSYRGHRLAWLLHFGDWPSRQIDHINGQRDDNRISNLRLATQSQNSMNAATRADNTSGVKGVGWFKPINKWQAYIDKGGRRRHLGYFLTKEEAVAARLDAERADHGTFRRSEQ